VDKRAMQPHPTPLPLGWRLGAVLWPAFLSAGVLEALVFSAIDPASLHDLHGGPLGWSDHTVYSVAFLVFWGAIAASGAVTQMLERPVD